MNQNQFIEGYRIIRVIQENIRMRQLRVLKEPESDRFILKLNSFKYPPQNELEELGLEYSLLKDLDLNGVLKVLELQKIGPLTVLCFEDFEGILLSEYIQKQPIGTELFLKIAVTLCRILHDLHCKGIVHGNIAPDSILIAPELHDLRLMNFDFAFKSTDKQPGVHRARDPERDLAYISPEQTLRVKHAPGIRSDLYSLGVVFYEMLTGKYPFPFHDPMELIYAHLAFKPVYPHELNQSIPPVVSKLIMKLIAKSPEERYQTAASLLNDLEKCSLKLTTTGAIEDFSLAQTDDDERFQIPQKIYGRENEIEKMVNAFQEASLGNPQIIMVSGPPGIGKSFLIEQFPKYIDHIHGFFISGKFDQYKTDIPYDAVISAFQKILQKILMAPTAKFDEWKNAIQAALGPNGILITKVLPELELIIGKQADIQQLGPVESRNRFHHVFRNFARVFSHRNHPLILFIDDFQWADSASLDLLKTILTDSEMQFFMFIGAHRNQEFNANPNCLATLQEIKNESKYRIQSLELAQLSVESLHEWVMETLPKCLFDTASFSKLVAEKSQGNPFFAFQFLQTLFSQRILCHESVSASWRLDWDAANATSFSDDIANLILSRFNQLSPKARELLQMAASLGNIFDLKTLVWVAEMEEKVVLEYLDEAVKNHFLVFLKSHSQNGRVNDPDSQGDSWLKFTHDRIQQTAYTIIGETERKTRHLQIGRSFLKRLNGGALEEYLFDTVYHFRQGLHLIDDRNERLVLAQLYLRAGQKAKRSAAYPSALDYLRTGLGLLETNSWRSYYNLTLALFTEAVETAYVCCAFDEVERLSQVALQNARNMLDKIKIYEIIIQTHISREELEQAVKTGLKALEPLGVRFPAKPGKRHLLMHYLKVHFYLFGKNRPKLLMLPQMTDSRQLAVMRIISALATGIYWSAPNLFPLIIFRNVISSIKYGNAAESPYAYAAYGLMLCSLGQIDAGHEFGALASQLAEKNGNLARDFKVKFVIITYLHHWKKHIRETLDPCHTLYLQCLESGENEFAAWSLMIYDCYFQWAGNPLGLVKTKLADHKSVLKSLKHDTAYNLVCLTYQGVINLLGLSADPVHLKGEAFDEDTMLPVQINANNQCILGTYCVEKMFLCYIFEEYEMAFKISQEATQYLDSVRGAVVYALYYIYEALIKLSVCSKKSDRQKQIMLGQIKKSLKRIKQWANHAPMNYLHRYCLIEAEYKRIQGRDEEAVSLYEQAIKLARESRYLYDEALANERAAQFYFAKKLPNIAATHLMDAHYLYDFWGAKAKTKQLETNYRQTFLNIHSFQKQFNTRIGDLQKDDSFHMDSIGSRIDVHALLQASHAIADEIIIDKLLNKLIRIVMESAGAEKVVLILKRGDEFYFEAEGSAAEGRITVLQGIPIQQIDSLPKSIIRYVIRKREILVLDHAQKDELFMDDPYVLRHAIKSVLCMPLIYQNELTAVLYMENNLNTGVFSEERQKVLSILGSQAAISLKNALVLRDFHNELEERKKTQKELDQYKDQLTKLVEERTAELRTTNVELEREILEKTRMEKQIKSSLKEKEMLLQEIHHRVKNNMQIISSLLNLQSRYIQDSKALEMFKESRDRVQSMALIHEILYQSADLARINLEKYISNLATNLYHSYGVDPNKIRLEIKIEKVLLGIDLAIPCGLIINELVSNALKYAFPATQYGSAMIQISLHPLDHNEVELIVQDNGIGIHSQANLHRENTLGLKLVSILTEEQLHGSLNIRDSQGTLFTIRFPL